MKYIKSIDSIRAIAVLLVIVGHWFGGNHKLSIITGIVNGVDIFFVLSGFLITRILIDNSEKAIGNGNSIILELKNFFFRRVLRIFPIYYLTIIILYLIGPVTETNIRENFLYFFTYTANFYFIKKDGWDGILSHLWSLSVEEQFYLIWPFIILSIKRKYILPTIVCFICVGIIGQYLTDVGGLYTFACFDALGFGALLAWIVQFRNDLVQKIYKPLLIISILSVFILSIRMAGFFYDLGFNPYKVPIRTLTSFITLWVLVYTIMKKHNLSLLDALLENKILQMLGRISYGLYLYHLILPHFTKDIFTSINSYIPFYNNESNFYLLRFENFVLLILFATLSYKFIETPFLRLKIHFQSRQVETLNSVSNNILASK